MTPLEFLQAIWPTSGVYCLATPFTPEGAARSTYAHKTFDTIEEAAAYAEKASHKYDLFFAVHSLKDHKLWNPNKVHWKTGEKGAFEVRTQANMQECKAFFFDIDVGEEEQKYHSQHEAIAGLKEFLVATRLPPPLLVSSGGGIHVYWLLKNSIPSEEWRDVAAKLKALANHYGLKIDNSRTTDTASVLRVAGTYNHKRGEKRPVVILTPVKIYENPVIIKQITDAAIGADVKVDAPRKLTPFHELLGEQGAVEFDGPPVTPKALASACVQMQYLIRSRGNVSEPLWYHGIIGVMRFTTGGRDLVHKVSAGHPDYSYEGCEAKIDSHEARRGADGRPLGPTGCTKLQAELPPEQAKLCDGCPFQGRVHGPISAARFKDDAPAPVVEEVVGPSVVTTTVPPPPKPYTRMASGGISVLAKNREGDEVHSVIYEHDLYPVRRLVNTQSQTEQQMWRVVLPRQGAKDFVLDADALYDRRKFASSLANQGIYPKGGNIELLQGYMVAYIAELQKLADAEAQSNHLGWAAEHTQFIMPDKILMQDGTAKPAMLSLGAQRASAQVQKKGTLQRQIELLEFYNHPAYIPNQFFILGSLAAPLFHMTGQHGVIVNASGDAGASKSTSLYTAASLWGNPILYPINGTNDGATVRGRNERITVLANLPICVDEITHIPIKEAKDLAMSISQPGHRIRLSTDGVERSATGSYKATVMLSTANSSLHNLLSLDNTAGTAGSMRVFEIIFTAGSIHQKYEADDYLHDIKENYGHIGEVFMTYVLQHQPVIHQRVRAVMRQIDAQCKIQSSERFWTAYIAVVIVAGEIANELGIIKYDVQRLWKWAVDVQVPSMRGMVLEEYTNPIGVLADYLEAINGDMIVVEKPHNGNIPNVPRVPRGQMVAHWSREDRAMWVLKKAFKDYCAKIGANSTKILTELAEPKLDRNGNMSRVVTHKNIKKVLGAGTEYAKAQTWCFVVNMAHPDISGLASLSVASDNPSPLTGVTLPSNNLKVVDGG